MILWTRFYRDPTTVRSSGDGTILLGSPDGRKHIGITKRRTAHESIHELNLPTTSVTVVALLGLQHTLDFGRL